MRHSVDFSRCIRSGARASSRHLVVHLLTPGTPDGSRSGHGSTSDIPTPAPARVGFVVSRAVGGAVQRNRVKRRLRELMRPRLAGLPDDTLVVVRALPAAGGASSDELRISLDRAWQTAGRGHRGGANGRHR